MFKHQITHLTVNIIDEIPNEFRLKLLIDIYNCIFALVINLKYLDLNVNSNYFFHRSLLTSLSWTTFSSSSIVHLRIKLNNFDDCRHLLDGRLSQLHTFIVNLDYICEPVMIRVNPAKLRKISSRIKINTVKKLYVIKFQFMFGFYYRVLYLNSNVFRSMHIFQQVNLTIKSSRLFVKWKIWKS